MALLGQSKTLSGIFTKGFVGNRLMAVGVKTGMNWIDKRFLGGKLTSTGVSLGKSLNGKPISINTTDLLLALTLTGIPTNTNKMIDAGSNFAVTKGAEAFDIIDPPMISGSITGNNVTDRKLIEKAKKELQEELALTTRPAAYATSFGGNYK